jgi:hypothetical protein
MKGSQVRIPFVALAKKMAEILMFQGFPLFFIAFFLLFKMATNGSKYVVFISPISHHLTNFSPI